MIMLLIYSANLFFNFKLYSYYYYYYMHLNKIGISVILKNLCYNTLCYYNRRDLSFIILSDIQMIKLYLKFYIIKCEVFIITRDILFL